MEENLMEVSLAAMFFFLSGFFIGQYRKSRAENLGEAAVRRVLVNFCRKSTAQVLNNVTLKYADGTTQIDHILITENGILVIETKHYRGWIFASSGREWTQVIYKAKHRFQNPLHQNAKHVKAVRQLLDFLPRESIQGVVVFTGDAQFKTDIPEGVIPLSKLQTLARDIRFGAISINRIQFCVGRIVCQRLELTGVTDVEHQKFLERKFGTVK
jgi:hypothetical protein